MSEIVLFISLLLQIITAVLVISIIRVTKSRVVWILIGILIILTGIGRAIDKLSLFSVVTIHEIHQLNNWIDLIISAVMLAGVLFIRYLFSAVIKSEGVLSEYEEKYRSLANTGDLIYMVDRNLNYILMNDTQASRLGFPQDKITGKSYREFHSEEDTREFMHLAGLVFDSGTSIQYEYRSERDNRYFLRTLSPVKNPSETTTVAVTVVAKDISVRKQMEEKLIESEMRLYNVIQGSPIPSFVIGKDHKVLSWNTALEQLTRIKAGEIIGTTRHWRAFYNSERPCMADLLVDQTLDKIPQWYSNKYIKSPLIDEAYEATGFFPELAESGKWIRFTAAVIRDSRGELVGAIETLEDVSERKLNELALKNSEMRLQSVIQGSPIPTFVIGKDHKIIYWNKALEELSGVKAGEVIGTTDTYRSFYREKRPALADLLVDQALDAIPQWYLNKYTKSSLLEEAYEATDFFPEMQYGGKWLRFTAALIRDSDGNLVGAVETFEDITERKRAEEQLIMARKLESLGILADGIAHDFNNLLSIMLHNIFAARLSLGDEQNGPGGEGLEMAEQAALQAKELAHRLVTFAKGGEPIKKIGSISQLLMDSVNLSLSSSNVVCKFSLPDDLWLIEMDDVQIRQVIHNLVVNAREAMSDYGTITISAENVDISAGSGVPLKEGKYVKWSVKDHGRGIPQENLQKIFDPYFATNPLPTARGKGLGLAICYSIVNRHHGFIGVDSELGVGSTFFVYLPACPREDSIKKVKTDRVDPKAGTILVMDDDDTVRNATGIVLNYLGYEVQYAKDGREAVDIYKAVKEKGAAFYAIVLDLYVPGGIGGREAMSELLATDPYVRAIVSSGNSDDPVVLEFRKHGFLAALDIPYDIEKMEKVLNNLPHETLNGRD
ncbi:MAG TPA: PAS domain S-box protein [Syntrophobacteraceae bacterium]|nr:PAS domain S-box protein [Syntrophobacteraceae bacterium]